MKALHFHHILAVILTATAMSFMFTSCNSKLNPEVKDLPGADFTISAIETRGTDVEFPWTISPSGMTDSVNEQIDEMYVTQYNKVTLTVKGNGAGFTGVNIESANPKVVQVHELSANNYVLIYVADGSTDISVWNGSGQGIKRTTFHVRAQEYIDIKGLRFSLGTDKDHTKNPVFVFSRFTTSRPPIRCNFPDDVDNIDKSGRPGTSDFMCMPYQKPMWYDYDYGEYGTYREDVTQGALLTFEGLEPENASFRTITSFESEWDVLRGYTDSMIQRGTFNEGDYVWPNIHSCNYDVSYFTSADDPTDMWIDWPFDCYMALVRIPIAEGARYYYVFRADDEVYEPIFPDVN